MTALSAAAAQVALLCGGAALAQTTAPAPAGAASAPAAAASAPAGAAASDDKGGDQAGQTIVVTGQRAALETAQKIKQNAEQIVDSVVADEAGKLPDKSITEVLQRVVGVTMDRNRSRTGGGALGFDVEGSGVQIRGLSWGSSTLNGRESFSAGWPGRELSWGEVPPELMAGVDVYKNPSAELVEGGISGQINLRTRLPFDNKGETGAFSASDNYSEFGGKNSPAISGLYSNRVSTDLGEFGALVDVSYNKSTYRADSVGVSAFYPRTDLVPGRTMWAPESVSWNTNSGQSERAGFYGALQWKKDGMESALTYFDSAFKSDDVSNGIFADSEFAYGTKIDNAKYDSNGVFQSGTLSYPIGGQGANQFAAGGLKMGTDQAFSHTEGRTRELAWNFKWTINDRWAVQNDLQWVHATNSMHGGMIGLGTFVPSLGLDVTTEQPTLTFDDTARTFLADPGNYYWNFIQPTLNKAEADLYAWKGDARFNFDDPVLRDVRFGLRLTERSSTHQNASGTGWKSIAEPWAVQPTKVAGQLPDAGGLGWQRANFGYMSDPRYQVPNGVNTFAFPNFFNGRTGQPPTIVVPAMALVRDYPGSYKGLTDMIVKECEDANAYKGTANDCSKAAGDWEVQSFDGDPKNTSKHSEDTQAIYGTLRFGFDDWEYPVEGNAGVRVIRSHTVAHGYTVFKPNYGSDPIPSVPQFGEIDTKLDVEASHIDVLPSLNLKMNFTPKLQSRLALSKGMYRPGFEQLQEYITLEQKVMMDSTGQNVEQITYTGTNSGNAKLKPVKSNNFDLSLEWYPRDGQSLTAVVFYKQVKDIIMSNTYTRTIKDLAGNPQDFQVTGPANAAKLWEAGIEVAGMTYFDKIPGLGEMLPDWAKGFGMSANYTYLDGKQDLYHPFKMPYCPAGNTSIPGNLYGCDTNGLPFQNLPVPYMSKNAFNVGFMYDQGPISARLAYSWRDRTLQATNAYGASGWDATSADPARAAANGGVAPKDVGWGLPVWQEAVGQWDAGLNYKVNDHMWTSFNVSNLTNVVTRQTQQQGIGDMGRAWFDPGRSYRLSMGYWF